MPAAPARRRGRRPRPPLVRRKREELGEALAERSLLEDRARTVLNLDLLELLVGDLADQLRRDRPPGGERHAVADPLPPLRAAALGRGGALHEPVDRRRPVTAEPGRDVLQPDVDV